MICGRELDYVITVCDNAPSVSRLSGRTERLHWPSKTRGHYGSEDERRAHFAPSG